MNTTLFFIVMFACITAEIVMYLSIKAYRKLRDKIQTKVDYYSIREMQKEIQKQFTPK